MSVKGKVDFRHVEIRLWIQSWKFEKNKWSLRLMSGENVRLEIDELTKC
jgi:hypothetical protein